MARDVFGDIFSEDALNVLWDIPTANHKSLIPIDGTFGPQFCERKLKHMIWIPMHHLANLLEIDPKRFFRTDCIKSEGNGNGGNIVRENGPRINWGGFIVCRLRSLSSGLFSCNLVIIRAKSSFS